MSYAESFFDTINEVDLANELYQIVDVDTTDLTEELYEPNNQSMVVSQDNALIEASYKLTLEEKRVLLASIAKVDPRDEVPDEIKIDGEEYARLFNINSKSAYSQLATGCERLFAKKIILTDKARGKRIYIQWLKQYEEDVIYRKGFGASIKFSDEIKPLLGNLKGNFTSYRLNDMSNLKSVHAIRIFEICSRFERIGARFIHLDDFRDKLQLGDKYPRFADLSRFVIQPALKEIDKKTPYTIDFDKELKGRKVVKLTFYINRKV